MDGAGPGDSSIPVPRIRAWHYVAHWKEAILTTRPIRVAAVDDHPLMLMGLGTALALRDGIEFVGTAETVDAVASISPRPDVVLLDLQLGDGSRPMDNARVLLEGGYAVLVYTDGRRKPFMADALLAGAQGIVLKGDTPDTLIDAIETVHGGETFLSAELGEVLGSSTLLRPQLSPREVEVLILVSQGLVSKQIARALDVKEATVKEHLKRIRGKYADLGRAAGTRVELHRRAIEDGHVDEAQHEIAVPRT